MYSDKELEEMNWDELLAVAKEQKQQLDRITKAVMEMKEHDDDMKKKVVDIEQRFRRVSDEVKTLGIDKS